jgi:hypothetical protein
MERAELTFEVVDDLVSAFLKGKVVELNPAHSFSPLKLGPLIELTLQSAARFP